MLSGQRHCRMRLEPISRLMVVLKTKTKDFLSDKEMP